MSVTVDTPLLDSLADRQTHRNRLEEISMRAAFLMEPYVPLQDRTLRPSVMASDFAAGMLTWNTPYALKQYMVPMHHSEDGTTDHWDEEMVRNDMPELKEYATQVYTEVP